MGFELRCPCETLGSAGQICKLSEIETRADKSKQGGAKQLFFQDNYVPPKGIDQMVL